MASTNPRHNLDRWTMASPLAARAWPALAAALLLATVCVSCASPRTQGQSADLAAHKPDATGGTADPSSAPASGPSPDQPQDAEELVAALVAGCRRGEGSTRRHFGSNSPFGRPFASYSDVGVFAGFDWPAARVITTQWLRDRSVQLYRYESPAERGRVTGWSGGPEMRQSGRAMQWIVNCRLSDGRAELSLLAAVQSKETPPAAHLVVERFAVLTRGEFWAEQLRAREDDGIVQANAGGWAQRYESGRTVLPQICEARVTDRLFLCVFPSTGYRRYHDIAGVYRLESGPVAVGGDTTISAQIALMGPGLWGGGPATLTSTELGTWAYDPPPGKGLPSLSVSVIPASDPSALQRTVRVKVGPAELDCPDVALTDGVLRLPRLAVFEWGPPAGSPEYEYRGFVLFRDGIATDYWLSNDPAVLQVPTTCPADAGRGSETQTR